MTVLSNLTPADVMGALLLLTLATLMLLLVRWTDGAKPLLLKEMIARAGGKLDAAADPLLGERLASAARACTHCRHRDEREAFLESEPGDTVPEFCPNRRWIRSLAATPA
jgi:hypothetical protein